MAKRKRERGSIRQRGDSYEVRVYAGTDPLTKKRIEIYGTADSPGAAEKLRTKLLGQVDENRHPKEKATVGQILDRWMTVHRIDEGTRERYEDLIRLYLMPAFGTLPASKLNAEMLELFYARLGRCKEQCEGKRDGKGQHHCKPLAQGTIRKLHFILRPALAAAVRWNYLTVNVATLIDAPATSRSTPDPPSAQEAAKILNAAWDTDPDWATYLWLAMVAGCRRGELCGVQWADVDFERKILTVAFSEQQLRHRRRRKDTKTHQQRRIAFDQETGELLLDLYDRSAARCAILGVTLKSTAYLFSYAPDNSTPWNPATVTQRYGRQARRAGLRSTRLHSLRHYSATELVASGVDLRTVAGRLGHGSGGATTLRVYSAWSPAADKRAATVIGRQLPRPGRQIQDKVAATINGVALICGCGNVSTWDSLHIDGQQISARCGSCAAMVEGSPQGLTAPQVEGDASSVPDSPYRRIAAALRERIARGELRQGSELPPLKEIAAQHDVTISTAHRAFALLAEEGLVSVSRGVRATVTRAFGEATESDSWAN